MYLGVTLHLSHQTLLSLHETLTRVSAHSKKEAMTQLLFFNCLSLSLLPSLAVFLLVLARYTVDNNDQQRRSSQLVILAFGSAFFWLLSILISSLFWWVKYHAIMVPISVLLQELSRFALWYLYEYGVASKFLLTVKAVLTRGVG